MKRNAVISVFAAALLAIATGGSALAADRSGAMEQHMRLMDAGNPGMERMMDAPPFHMPPVHP
jgi:hypothetical protein